MKPTNRKLKTSAGYGTGEYTERVIHIGNDGKEYVEQDGEWISVEGAKMFRAAWPVAGEVQAALDVWKRDIFPNLSPEEQSESLAELLEDLFRYAQSKEVNRGEG